MDDGDHGPSFGALVRDALTPIGRATELVRAVDEDAWLEKRFRFFAAPVAARIAASEPDHAVLRLPERAAAAAFGHESHRWAVARR